MPTLLQINSVANIGSTGHIAEQLGEYMMQHGWTSYIAYGRDAAESASRLIPIGGKLDILTHVALSRITGRHGLYSVRATKKFLAEVERIKPDVVHIHNLHGYYINYPMLFQYLSRKQIPTVITLHDFWLMTGHCAGVNVSCVKWKTGCHDCNRLKWYPQAMMDSSRPNWIRKRRLFKGLSNITLVPVSVWLNNIVKQSLLKDITSCVICNGINTDFFKPVDNCSITPNISVDWNKFTILCVATRWTHANGFDDVINLSYILPDNVQIIMIGVDDIQLKGLPQNIVGMKRTEDVEELRTLYNLSDVLYNPNTEGTFGLVTAEAMACGTPAVVMANSAGEEIIDESTGYSIHQYTEIPNLIPKIKESKIIHKQLCRKRIVSLFNVETQREKYMELYNSLINR
jgi:glycosyltransferase involved in cell wall biosynthesis